MMKKLLNLSLSGVLLLALLNSCSTDDKIIDGVFDNISNGAVLRTISLSNELALGDDSSVFTVEIEAQDVEEGNLLSEVRVFVRFEDNTDDGTDYSSTETQALTISASEFSPGPFGLPRTTIAISNPEFYSITGVDQANTFGGDQFEVRLELELTDGRVFSNDNAGGIITGGFFASPFFYNANITCPFTTSLAETFDYVSYNMGPGDGSGGQQATGFGPINGTITWTDAGEEGLYGTPDYSFGMFGFVWGDNPATNGSATIKWFCSSLIPQGADQYSDTYVYDITNVSGPTMTIEWSNTWGDIGTVDLTREGGADWPAVFGGSD